LIKVLEKQLEIIDIFRLLYGENKMVELRGFEPPTS